MKKVVAIMLAMLIAPVAQAELVGFVPELAMTGGSSAFNDGAWVRVVGQVGHANCYYAPGNVSLFYARTGGPAEPKNVLAILLTAKTLQKQVYIDYDPNGVQADFWGFGISS